MRTTSNNTTDGQQSRPNNLHIGIIGAGVAGLGLANVLHSNDSANNNINNNAATLRTISYELFSSDANNTNSGEQEATTMYITFCLPHWKDLLQRIMGVPTAATNTVDGTLEDDMIRRDHLLACLQRGISNSNSNFPTNTKPKTTTKSFPKSTVRYNTTIVQIRQKPSTTTTATTTNNNNTLQNNPTNKNKNLWLVDQNGHDHGPFDVIVVANGVMSAFRNTANNVMDSSVADRIVLMGDARWVRDQWWDLGLVRIRSGAHMALQDALLLGRTLVQSQQQQQQYNTRNQDWLSHVIPPEYLVSKRLQQQRQRNNMVLSILWTILLFKAVLGRSE